jgi:hypothetical protein
MRVTAVGTQILGIYKKIIWNTGYLTTGWTDGTGNPGKSDDTGFILSFLNGLEQYGGIWLNGDNAGDIWDASTGTSAVTLKNTYMNFLLDTTDHKDDVNISPWVVGEAGGIFEDAFAVPDTMIANGGCPLIKNFDVYTQDGASVVQAQYHQNSIAGGGTGPVPAVLSQVTWNGTTDVGFIMEGFGYQYIADDRPQGIPDRVWHMYRILDWLGNPQNDPVGTRPTDVAVNELRQNRPNPFNPTTTIEFQVKHTGPVSLKIYNVAGQLVRTLVDEQVSAGKIHTSQWKGLNDAGQQVSSGVYFYKLVATNYTQTKKMILLK